MPFSSADPADYLAIGKQPDEATEASTFNFVRHLRGGLEMDLESETIYEGGGGQDPTLVYLSKRKPDGEIEHYSRPKQFTFMGAYAMGSAVAIASVNPAAVASHLYVPNSTAPYLTIEEAFGGGNQINRVTAALLTGFRVEGEAGQPWKVTNPFLGGGTAYRRLQASALTQAYESTDPAMYAGGAYLLDGATSLDITKFSYQFERKADDDLYTTDTYRRAVVLLNRRCGVDFTLIYQNASVYQKYQYGAAGATVLPADLPTGAFQAERVLTASQLLGLYVPLMRVTAVKLNRLVPDGETMLLDVSAEAVKGGTHLTYLRGNITGQATSYLL